VQNALKKHWITEESKGDLKFIHHKNQKERVHTSQKNPEMGRGRSREISEINKGDVSRAKPAIIAGETISRKKEQGRVAKGDRRECSETGPPKGLPGKQEKKRPDQ